MYLLFQEKHNEYCPSSTSLWMAFVDSKRNWKHYQVIIKLVLCLSLLVLGLIKYALFDAIYFWVDGGGGGGGKQESQNLLHPVPCSSTSCTFISRLPPISMLLPCRDLRSPARLTFLQFDSLRDTCALMLLDILWPIWRNHCKLYHQK